MESRPPLTHQYKPWPVLLYNSSMEVAVSTLRAHLSDWLDRARAGEEVVVTERGLPVARLVGLGTTTALERLTKQGVISKPESLSKPRARERRRVRATGSVADLVSEQRR